MKFLNHQKNIFQKKILEAQFGHYAWKTTDIWWQLLRLQIADSCWWLTTDNIMSRY